MSFRKVLLNFIKEVFIWYLKKKNLGTDISNVTALLRSPAPKIQKMLVSFLGLYRFHPDYRLASGK